MGKAARQKALLKAVARGWTAFEQTPVTPEMRQRWPQLEHVTSVWANNRFEVHVYAISTPIGGVNQVNIARHGQIEDVSWEDGQRVVHELFGPEVLAVELYPPFEYEWQTNVRVRILWVLPSTYSLPVGLHCPGAWGKPHVE